jgi:hypothetical protein
MSIESYRVDCEALYLHRLLDLRRCLCMIEVYRREALAFD